LQQLDRERSEGAVNESAQQVAFADKILLNKVDSVDDVLLEETKATIRSINTLAPIRTCSMAKNPDEVPLGELLSIDAFDATRLLVDGESLDDLLNPGSEGHEDGHSHDTHSHDSKESHGHSHSHSKECADPECSDESHGHSDGHSHSHESHGNDSHGHGHDADCTDAECTDESHGHAGHSHGHSHSHNASVHDTDIGSMVLEMEGKLDLDRFQAFMDDLILQKSIDLYRYKGILAVERKQLDVRYVLQGVHDMKEVSFSGDWPEDRPMKTQVVIIGRKLDKDELNEKFQHCSIKQEVAVE
jgi:G3E family GTPase